MEPKVLVISNECFSKSSSNGRTLGNFFLGWPKDRLAQFFISSGKPDFDYCKNYFQVTDGQALSALKTGRCNGGRIGEPPQTLNSVTCTTKKRKRNALTMLARNFVWESGRWKKCGFKQWVKEFNPDIILLQAGDFAFMYRLAVRLAEKCQAKLIIYNSEGYYFKDFDYFRSSGIAKMVYPMFWWDLKRALKRAYGKTTHIFYACDELKREYDEVFSVPSETLYTASEIKAKADGIEPTDSFITSYCGNLGIERHKGLIAVAEELQKISPEFYVDVYGKIPNEKVQEDFDACKGIRYHGLVSYGEVKRIIDTSDLLLHIESFDDFYKEDLKFAFSTKIADLLSSGNSFLLYGPEQLACSKYLRENDAAFVVSDSEKLGITLREIIAKPEIRKRHRKNALMLAEKNHRGGKNVAHFQSVLKNI